MWVHACEQRRLVHYVKAGMNLTGNTFHVFLGLAIEIMTDGSLSYLTLKQLLIPLSSADKIADTLLLC